MKTLFAFVLCSFVLALALQHQDDRVRRGELIILHPTEGQFQGGPVFVDKTDRTITMGNHFPPTTLWRDKEGVVMHRLTVLICGRVPFYPSIPANGEALELYRTYFPRM